MFDTGNDDNLGEGGGPDRAGLHVLLDRVLDADPEDPGSVLGEVIEAHATLGRVLDGRLVGVLAGWEASGDWAHDGSPTAVGWLVNHTGIPRKAAGGLRRTGHLAASIPAVGDAAAGGVLPLSHLHLLTRARKPEVADVFDRDVGRLVDEARVLTADALKTMLVRWHYAALEELGRNEADRDPDPHGDRDTLTVATTFGERAVLRGEYGPVGAATLIESIDAELDSWFRTGLLDGDTRTRDELRAAAHLAIIARGALANTSHHGPRPLIHAHIALTDLFNRAATCDEDRFTKRTEILNGGPAATQTVRDLLCDADLAVTITDDDHQPLYCGRTQRNSTATQHRALILQTGGTCATPGCDRPHQWCHDHHITWWEHHGTTDISNLVLVCTYHHQAIHQGHLHVTQGPNGPHFTTPTGQPLHHPYNNTG